jgi:integrase
MEIIIMRKGQNSNRPGKGSSIKVEPIRDLKDIKLIKKLLADNPRDLCLFVLGINTNLRASDLCRITVKNVRDLKEGDDFAIKEKKTGKAKRITANRAVVEAIQALLSAGQYDG